MNTSLSARRFALGLGLITLLSALLNLAQIGRQPVSADDLSVALSAINYMENGQLGPTMWNHPCLRNILVYGALRLFGAGVVGVKGVSLLLGILCTPLVGLVARRIFRDGRIGLVAALLWTLDALVIEFTRQGINDIYLAFFPLAAIYLCYRFRDSGNHLWLFGGGICFGLGLASKLSSLLPLAATLALLAWLQYRESRGAAGRLLAGWFQLAVLLVLLPALVYLMTFLPWFSRGYTLTEWVDLQRSMLLETSQHTGYKPKPWNDTDHRAWKWFVAPSVFVDPFLNLDIVDPAVEHPSVEDSTTVVLGYANPLVWFLVLPALFVTLRRGIRERDEGCLYLGGLFLVAYLPLVATWRPIWMNTSLSVLPYAVMLVAGLVWRASRATSRPAPVLAVYLTAVALVAAPLYLLAIGKGMRIPVLKQHFVEQYLAQMKKKEAESAQKGQPPGAAMGLPPRHGN
jgi:4-amino-4-deoxy-L-arabinose transferase-like glycosyltransferase